MNKERKFWDLLHELRRNYGHFVCTMGSCSTDGCDNPARGGGTCPNCIEDEMAELIGDRYIAGSIHHHTRMVWLNINEALKEVENE